MSESNQSDPSPTERRIGRLVVPELAGFPQNERIDWIHDVELERVLMPRPEQGDW